MKRPQVNIEWRADDGYVGGDRPHVTALPLSIFEPGMTDEEIEQVVYETVEDDFAQRVTVDLRAKDVTKAIAEIRALLKATAES